MPKLPQISGQEVIKILTKYFGSIAERQKGSHVKLRKNHLYFTVPLHPTLKKGTLNAILKQAEVSVEDFLKHI